ncbi:MAG: cell wall hydrolase, partial [Kineothrix sp.]|nr:cell wall hydrolase [Kineothrix sp.]
MSGNRKPFYMLSCLVMGLMVMMAASITARAGEEKTSSQEYLDSLNVGVAVLLDSDTDENMENSMDDAMEAVDAQDDEKETVDDILM